MSSLRTYQERGTYPACLPTVLYVPGMPPYCTVLYVPGMPPYCTVLVNNAYFSQKP